ncbi:RyR domain-containing protein [Haliea sp. E17]|uniref:RyR domain-containing protein n=1 Tax=Haliea sp. E17 TaxID=3401576 RepID=UPI003AAC9886
MPGVTNPSHRAEHNLGKKPASFFSRHEWTLVGMLAVGAFLLACLGYTQVMLLSNPDGSHTWWDVVYASLQLFVFEGPDATTGWPLHLQVARALAPMILLYTAAKAVWSQVDHQVSLYWLLSRKRRFVVICGIGETGFRIARDYLLNSDKGVVVIDNDPLNPMVAELKHMGAITVHGNAMDPLVLHDTRVVYAKELFLCTSDDKANIAIAKAAERLTRRLKDREVKKLDQIAERHEQPVGTESAHLGLRCFMCVDTPDIYEVFSAHSFFETNSPRFAIRLFNRRETFARNIFQLCAPDLYHRPVDASCEPMHVLFIGFTALVRELIIQTALTAHYTDFRLPRATVLCSPEREEEVGRFLYRYPHLAKTLEIEFIYADPLTIDEDYWRQIQAQSTFKVCYVAMRQDVEGILCARRLNRLRRLAKLPPLNFVVCLNQQNFLAEIIDDDFEPIRENKARLPVHEPIEYFEILDETLTIDVVVNEALDLMARTLHNDYARTQIARGENAGNNASLIPWSELPAHKKRANQRAAAHIDIKLRLCGCTAYSELASAAEIAFPPDASTLEQLARLEHHRWMADKYLAGYSYGEQRDEDQMLHPDLVPWEALTEADKEKDRDNIRRIPALLHLQQLKVCRLGSRNDD